MVGFENFAWECVTGLEERRGGLERLETWETIFEEENKRARERPFIVIEETVRARQRFFFRVSACYKVRFDGSDSVTRPLRMSIERA